MMTLPSAEKEEEDVYEDEEEDTSVSIRSSSFRTEPSVLIEWNGERGVEWYRLSEEFRRGDIWGRERKGFWKRLVRCWSAVDVLERFRLNSEEVCGESGGCEWLGGGFIAKRTLKHVSTKLLN